MSLEKSKNECQAVARQLEQAKQDYNKLAADKKLVCYCILTFLYMYLNNPSNYIALLSWSIICILIFTHVIA